jgi:hypothetical protein
MFDEEPAPEFIDPAEDCPWRTPREIFARFGYAPAPPSELNDQQLTGRLWELLYAAAARRFFFCQTNHLDDRALYTLLWEEWLDEPTADIPLEAETNTTTFASAFNTPTLSHEDIWLRYYADDADREYCRASEPEAALPPHEDPPCDRDRFLPTAPLPLEAHATWMPEDGELLMEDHQSDPLGLADVDREIAEARDANAGLPSDTLPQDAPDTALEAELRASEPENWTPPAQQLTQDNVPLLPPDEITEETLTPILWELLHNLALRGFYVLHTDHLSDRELYSDLWRHGLRDPAHLPGRHPRGGWFHDFLGSWGEDELKIWLRYYASDAEGAAHAKEWPQDVLPLREKPPFNRDWRLPKGPF